MALSNIQLWNYLRKTNPNFKSQTSEGTKELFTERGYDALRADNIDALNDFFKLSMRVAFQKIDASKAKNPLENSGLVEVYTTPNGGYTQRMAINSIKPVTPKFKNLQDGQSVDPFVVRKPEIAERFFQQNFDFQSWITIQDFQVKTIFISEYGMSDFIAGIMQGLMNGYTLQRYVNILNCLHNALVTANYPLQDSQKIEITGYDDPTEANLKNLILQIKDIATQFEVSSQTSAFNALGFATTYDADDFVCLMKAGIKNRIATALMVGAFNPETLSIPFEVKEVENFGGLTPYDSNETLLQEVYDVNGVVVGYVDAAATINGPATKRADGEWIVNITIGGQTADTTIVHPEAVVWDDPHENVLCVIAQKGVIFENIQNGIENRPIYNPRGLYENYWLSAPNNTVAYDPLYGMIVISKPSE